MGFYLFARESSAGFETTSAMKLAHLFWILLALYPFPAQGAVPPADGSATAPLPTLPEPGWYVALAGPPSKLSLVSPWADTTIKFLQPGSSGTSTVKSTLVDLPAIKAVYTAANASGKSVEGPVEVVAVNDPISQKTCIIYAPPKLPASQPAAPLDCFYISTASGLKLYTAFLDLDWSDSLVVLPASPGSMDAAIARFESQYDGEKLSQLERTEIFHNRISFEAAAPPYFFSDAPGPGNAIVGGTTEAVDLTDGILHLDLRNRISKIPASFWIDLHAGKVTKSVVDGREMDLNTGQHFAEPLSSPPVAHSAPPDAAASKLSLKSAWTDCLVRLVTPASSGTSPSPSRTEEVKARAATYEFTPTPSPPLPLPDQVPVLAHDDPHNHKTAVISASPFGFPADSRQTFFVSDNSVLTCFGIMNGWLRWKKSFLEVPTITGQPDAAISQFETAFNGQKFMQEEFDNDINAHALQIGYAVPEFFFSKDPARSVQLRGTMAGDGMDAPIFIDSADLTAGILRIEIRNPITKKTATLWVNLKTESVTKSMVDGREMKLIPGQPAVPVD